jgi:hypothetical protein
MANKDNARIGDAYRRSVKRWVEDDLGWFVICENHRHKSGVEFDIYCLDNYGREVGIECKASNDDASGEKSMARTDNVWKVLGYLGCLKEWALGRGSDLRDLPFRYVVVASHLGKPGSHFRQMLDREEMLGFVTVVEMPWDGWRDEAEGGWPAGTKEVADLLVELDVPLDASVRRATEMLRNAGLGRGFKHVQAAVKYRRQAAEVGDEDPFA